MDVEIWPTSIVVPQGHRIALTVRGKDYVYPGDPSGGLGEYQAWTGVAIFRHDDPIDRPADVFGGKVALHTGRDRPAYLLLPVIPPK